VYFHLVYSIFAAVIVCDSLSRNKIITYLLTCCSSVCVYKISLTAVSKNWKC